MTRAGHALVAAVRRADPTGEESGEECETHPMPVLDPNPKNGQKKMLLVFGAFLLIFVIIGVIASIASP